MRDGFRHVMLSGATGNEASKWILRFTTLRSAMTIHPQLMQRTPFLGLLPVRNILSERKNIFHDTNANC